MKHNGIGALGAHINLTELYIIDIYYIEISFG